MRVAPRAARPLDARREGGVGLEVIDAWAQLPTERFMEQPWLETLLRWTRQERACVYGKESTLAAMDDGGAARALICAWSSPTGMVIDYDEVAAAVSAHPDRFAGVGAVDLRQPVAAVRELRRTVAGWGSTRFASFLGCGTCHPTMGATTRSSPPAWSSASRSARRSTTRARSAHPSRGVRSRTSMMSCWSSRISWLSAATSATRGSTR